MDDILASIRRILNEEDAKPSAAPSAPSQIPSHLPSHPGEAPDDDVLDLEPGMMVTEPDEHPLATVAEAESAGPVPLPPPILAEPIPNPVTAAPMPDERPPVPLPHSTPTLVPPALVAPAAAAAAASSVGALMRTLATERSTAVHRGGPTLEDLVREEMRPLLKEWLDQHLAPMVERLVRAEIERVVSRMT